MGGGGGEQGGMGRRVMVAEGRKGGEREVGKGGGEGEGKSLTYNDRILDTPLRRFKHVSGKKQ